MHDKIKKLLAMAHHPNSDPNEAAVAAAMAARLALQHNIDIDSLTEKAPKEFVRDALDIDFPRRDDQARIWLMTAVAEMFGVKPYNVNYGATRRVLYVGQKHNTELAKSWTAYLWESCKRANTEHARRACYGSREAREEARSAFRFGFCLAVAKRIGQSVQEMKTQGVPESGSTALVVSAWFEQERREVEAWVKTNINASKGSTGTRVRGTQEARDAGLVAGAKVSLNKQLT
jgi:hypothetical protein